MNVYTKRDLDIFHSIQRLHTSMHENKIVSKWVKEWHCLHKILRVLGFSTTEKFGTSGFVFYLFIYFFVWKHQRSAYFQIYIKNLKTWCYKFRQYNTVSLYRVKQNQQKKINSSSIIISLTQLVKCDANKSIKGYFHEWVLRFIHKFQHLIYVASSGRS